MLYNFLENFGWCCSGQYFLRLCTAMSPMPVVVMLVFLVYYQSFLLPDLLDHYNTNSNQSCQKK